MPVKMPVPDEYLGTVCVVVQEELLIVSLGLQITQIASRSYTFSPKLGMIRLFGALAIGGSTLRLLCMLAFWQVLRCKARQEEL